MATIYRAFLCSLLFFCCCKGVNPTNGKQINSNKEYDSALTEQKKLPFIGKKHFETRPGVSGTGTPHWMVEIKSDSTVEFSFVQINQADKNETKGTYNAGKFRGIMKSVFKEWYNETRHYKISADKIYEVDSNGNVLKLPECCSLLEEGDCRCEGELYIVDF